MESLPNDSDGGPSGSSSGKPHIATALQAYFVVIDSANMRLDAIRTPQAIPPAVLQIHTKALREYDMVAEQLHRVLADALATNGVKDPVGELRRIAPGIYTATREEE